jgi:hypothetical protein
LITPTIKITYLILQPPAVLPSVAFVHPRIPSAWPNSPMRLSEAQDSSRTSPCGFLMARGHLCRAPVAARATQPCWLHLWMEEIIAVECYELILHVRRLRQWQATQVAKCCLDERLQRQGHGWGADGRMLVQQHLTRNTTG